MPFTRDDVLRNYGDGVDAIERHAGGLRDRDWDSNALGVWNAEELVTHVALIAAWYHERVDRAERGDLSPSYNSDDFDQWTIEQVANAAPASPQERVSEFTTAARSYAARLPGVWDVALWHSGRVITVGQHAALAAVEWQVHAWDLARVTGIEHVPSDPASLAAAAADAVTAMQRNGRVARRVVPWIASHQRDPWRALLERLGRC